ncbi:MAG: diaminopimelate decarboxylase [Planctomycetes bacterium]|nr:diaminopimelate decarboxylase [Planctomycetota bacterium]
MDHFEYVDGELHCDGVSAQALADRWGTPLYVYCSRTIEHHYRVLTDAFAAAESPPLICYSVKANSNLHLLRQIATLGGGFDVVSGGELARVREIGGDPARVVYAGVGKTSAEIRAAVDAGILLFNVEAESELRRIAACARETGRTVGVAIRVNPDVDPKTHRYITTGKRENKFGVDLVGATRTLSAAAELDGVECRGLHIHLGSQITDTAPYVEGVRKVIEFLRTETELTSTVRYLDIGGGFGVHYRGEEALPASDFARAILPELKGTGLRVILEPGRFIVANAGILITRVVTTKKTGGRRFVICDAGMNDLVRPSLYQAFHRIEPVSKKPETSTSLTDVVGPICETGDFLGLDRELGEIDEGDLLAVFTAGAYGMTMASNYNTRPRPAEVMVERGSDRLIRRRETFDDLVRAEREIG